MSGKIVGATEFKADCLRLIDDMNRSGEPVTITRRGKPVASLVPVARAAPASLIGALNVAAIHYDEPFAPAVETADWDAAR